jgi:hypothetical protein
MFEFGRDLRKLFEKARESDDLGWLELIGADLVESEARGQATDAGRVSTAKPFDGWMRASALYREHARRTGRQTSLDRAARAASDAVRAAATADQRAAAGIEAVEIHMQAFDLFGGPSRLSAALEDIQALAPDRPATRAWSASAHARLNARRARLAQDASGLMDAAALMDSALMASRHLSVAMADELRLERAGLSLEVGVSRCDAHLLDQAGRDLRGIVNTALPEQRPMTRARALAMAGAGLRALATMAGDPDSVLNGRALFESAADQFTPDHSPLDWVGVQLAHADQASLAALSQCEALTREPGLILGAMARERRVAVETNLAQVMGDLKALSSLETTIKARLLLPTLKPLDWAAEQIGLARIGMARARLMGVEPRGLGMVLSEAALTAREQGAETIARSAEAALQELTPA